jgi:hypothetical protein
MSNPQSIGAQIVGTSVPPTAEINFRIRRAIAMLAIENSMSNASAGSGAAIRVRVR